MNISNSKKQLAKIISVNGGWPRSAEYSSQDGSDGKVSFYRSGAPIYNKLAKRWNAPGSCMHMYGSRIEGLGRIGVIKNFHQTILARDEYFHLYPAPDADGWIEWKGGECPVDGQVMIDVKFRYGACATSGADCFNFTHDDHKASDIIAYRLHKPERQQSTAVGDDETNLAAKEELEALEFEPTKPTIEQLAADYRVKLAIAQQAQEEVDAANREADAALCKLEHAGEAIGLLVSPIKDEIKMEVAPSLNITDWRDLQVGDIIECLPGFWAHGFEGRYGQVVGTEDDDYEGALPVRVEIDGEIDWGGKFKFIRRP